MRSWLGVVSRVALLVAVSVAVADAGLLAHWSFDEGSGLTVTDSANGNVGTFHEGATAGVNGPTFSAGVPAASIGGTSLLFDGTNDYVSVPDSPSVSPTGDITLAAWVNAPTFAGASRNILAKHDNNAYRWRINSNGQLWALLNDGAGSPPHELFWSGALAPSGAWHHTALTVDFTDSNVRFYVDGDLVSTRPMNSTISIQDTSGPLRIGASNNVGLEAFNGNMDDVGIWDERLGDGLVRTLYTVPVDLGLAYDISDMSTLWAIRASGAGGSGGVEGIPWSYTESLPGSPVLGDAYVNGLWYYVVLGDGSGLVATLPEPGTLSLLALGGLGLLRRRRRKR